MSLGIGDPFRRDGHLSHFAIEGWVLELLGENRARVHTHLELCGACRHRVDAVLAHERGTALVSDAPVQVTPVNRPWPRGAIVGFAAAAATLMALVPMAMPPAAPLDTMRVKGSNTFTLTVFADEGGHARALESHDVVSADQRLGFQVQSPKQGHVLIVGIDDRGDAYPCYPLTGSAPMVSSDGPVDLEAAVRLDGVAGSEHLIGLWCEDPVAVERVIDLLERSGVTTTSALDDPILRGCEKREVRLTKEQL